MENVKLTILCARQDALRMQKLIQELEKLGVRADLIGPGEAAARITEAKVVVVFLSKSALDSQSLVNGLLFAHHRGKTIIPVLERKDLQIKDAVFEFTLAGRPTICLEDDYTGAAGKLYDLCASADTKELLYEKIVELSKIDYRPGIASNLSDLILLICREIEKASYPWSRRDLYKELLRCMERLSACYSLAYTPGYVLAASKRQDAINEAEKVLANSDFHTPDLFLIALALKMIYLHFDIQTDIAEVRTNGHVTSLGPDIRQKKYLDRQAFYLKIYNSQMVSEGISKDNHGPYPEDELELILHAPEFLIDKDAVALRPRESAPKAQVSDTETQLYAIANYIRQSNKLFELLGSGHLAVDFLKCLKTSYERLRKYSEVVGCREVCAECIERIAELNQQLERFGPADDDAGIAASGLKALLGFSLPGAGEFDVFLSYKHEDADIARSVYHFLKSNILNPFFDDISLPELSKSEYEDAIMSAIEHSKHFIVVISKLEYLDSFWVELEMKTFRHEMVEGRKKDANFIIIVTNDVYQEIISTNKQCLPIKYRSYEIMRVDDYKRAIISYLR